MPQDGARRTAPCQDEGTLPTRSRKLAEGDKLLAGGAELDSVCRHLEIAESTWHRWRNQFGGVKANSKISCIGIEGDRASIYKVHRATGFSS